VDQPIPGRLLLSRAGFRFSHVAGYSMKSYRVWETDTEILTYQSNKISVVDNLQAGDILIRISDGSKWKFLHYKTVDTIGNTVREDYQGDSYPAEDKNLVHVRAWDNETNTWKEGDHEEFATTEFEKE
jgi:hypothetical protein